MNLENFLSDYKFHYLEKINPPIDEIILPLIKNQCQGVIYNLEINPILSNIPINIQRNLLDFIYFDNKEIDSKNIINFKINENKISLSSIILKYPIPIINLSIQSKQKIILKGITLNNTLRLELQNKKLQIQKKSIYYNNIFLLDKKKNINDEILKKKYNNNK